jgi:hypothetical protein
VTVQKLPGQARALAFERTTTRQPQRLRGNPDRSNSTRERVGVGCPERLASQVQLSRSTNVRVPPVVPRDEVPVDEPAAELDVVGAEHRADVGQPIDQAPVHLILAKRPARLDRAGGERQDQRSVAVREKAEVQAGLEDQPLEAGWELHRASLPGHLHAHNGLQPDFRR